MPNTTGRTTLGNALDLRIQHSESKGYYLVDEDGNETTSLDDLRGFEDDSVVWDIDNKCGHPIDVTLTVSGSPCPLDFPGVSGCTKSEPNIGALPRSITGKAKRHRRGRGPFRYDYKIRVRPTTGPGKSNEIDPRLQIEKRGNFLLLVAASALSFTLGVIVGAWFF